MFEAQVLHLLRRYLGEYVHGLSSEVLRISVWKGDVVLKDLKLKADALNSLKLPVTVKTGFVGTITLKAIQVHSSIEQAMSTYAPKEKEIHKRKVKRPYAATSDVSTAEEVFIKECPWSSQPVPAPISTFGSSSGSHH